MSCEVARKSLGVYTCRGLFKLLIPAEIARPRAVEIKWTLTRLSKLVIIDGNHGQWDSGKKIVSVKNEGVD